MIWFQLDEFLCHCNYLAQIHVVISQEWQWLHLSSMSWASRLSVNYETRVFSGKLSQLWYTVTQDFEMYQCNSLVGKGITKIFNNTATTAQRPISANLVDCDLLLLLNSVVKLDLLRHCVCCSYTFCSWSTFLKVCIRCPNSPKRPQCGKESILTVIFKAWQVFWMMIGPSSSCY